MPSETTYNGVSDVTTETIVTTVNTTSDIVSTTSTDNTTATTTATTTVAITVQTESEEEKALKARYEAAKSHLAEYVDKGSFIIEEEYKYGAAVKYLYDEFEALGDYKDCKEILTGFTVLPNMLTSITMKQINPLGYEMETVYASYTYDENGNLKNNEAPFDLRILGFDDDSYVYANDYLEYEFDDAGKLVLANLSVGEKTIAVITPEYDEKGNIVKVTTLAKGKTYTQVYEYDDQNRVNAATRHKYFFDDSGAFFVSSAILDCEYSYDKEDRVIEEIIYSGSSIAYTKMTYMYNKKGFLVEKIRTIVITQGVYGQSNPTERTTYTYDENGKLISESFMGKDKEYFYDDNGYLIKETEKVGKYLYERVYVNDENGRHISVEITEMKNGEPIGDPEIVTYNYEYNYETLYFYNAK